MSEFESALIAVGRDCDCGLPLVWRGGQQRCAVYGTHPGPGSYVTFRNQSAPGAALIDALTEMSYRRSGNGRDNERAEGGTSRVVRASARASAPSRKAG